MDRRLNADEDALWARVTATVRALRGDVAATPLRHPGAGRGSELPSVPREALDHGLRRGGEKKGKAAPAPRPVGDTLDGGWDKRLARGMVAPDRTIDLHGYTLVGAHAALDAALGQAILDGARLLLVVTGRAPQAKETAPRRGLIRAAIGDWLAVSPHAGGIAAVRGAHPRHGGAGALYVVLRRRR